MPCLNSDLLFDVGKQLVENDDSEAVIKFALSGNEALKAMKRMFSYFKILELHSDCYVIGWDKLCCKFVFRNNEPPIKFLLYQTGNCIQKLHIDSDNLYVYQPVLEKILTKKQLTTFSAGDNCDVTFLEQFLPLLASSLKHATIPSKSMTSIFRDTFNLESLNVLNYDGFNIASFCCKTETLEINRTAAFAFKYFPGSRDISPFLPSIKQLIINEACDGANDAVLSQIMKHFSSLEILEQRFAIRYFYSFEQSPYINSNIGCLIKFVRNAAKVPSKVTYSITIDKKSMSCWQPPCLVEYKNICFDFEFDETISDFYCFRKLIQSAGTQSTLFGVQFFMK